MSTAIEVWPYAEVPDSNGIFVCGCLERWVSIALQGTRALNLAWALVAEGRVGAGQRVAVVGGGFAGMTLAAGLSRLGVRVTLLERNARLLGAQRDNRVRWIHPHLHEWPRPNARQSHAGLPVLDWTAGLSADVAAEVLAGFEAEVAQGRITLVCSAGDIALHGDAQAAPALAWGGQTAVGFDAVILALGVGIERTFGALPLASYWADDTVATITAGPPRRHLVTGIGEGGVIDTLYLCLADFSHAAAAEALAAIPGMAAVEAALLALEAEVEGLDDAEANRRISAHAATLAVPAAVDDWLRARRRTDTQVTLNAPEPFALAARADILNRFLIGRLLALGIIEYRSGRVADIQPEGAGWQVTLEAGATMQVDHVNIRHGTVPTLKVGFPTLWDRYLPHRMSLPHLTPRPLWPPGAFNAG